MIIFWGLPRFQDKINFPLSVVLAGFLELKGHASLLVFLYFALDIASGAGHGFYVP